MIQTMKEYQNEFFKKEGYVFFKNLQEAAETIGNNRGIDVNKAARMIENDTNADCVILNDGSVAVHPNVPYLHGTKRTENN